MNGSVEELVARGGTFGLLLALVITIGFLVRFATKQLERIDQAYRERIAMLERDRDDWKAKATRAVDGFADVSHSVKALTDATATRNRIDEERLRQDAMRAQVETERIEAERQAERVRDRKARNA